MPRLFIALRPPAPVRAVLLDTMEGIEGARWQDEAQLHLTLRFLGDVEERRAEDLAAAIGAVRAPPFALDLRGAGHFEHKGVINAVWAGLAPSPALDHLQRKIERACQRAGIPAETRTFVPHITLARLGRASGPVGDWLVRHAMLRGPDWPVGHFALYQSHLRAGGSVYEEQLRWPLRA